MFSQLIVTKHWTKEKKLWNLPSISELWISILEALTSPARIFQSSQSLCCHHLCLCLNIRDRSWKTTQHLVENRVVITLSLLEHQISELKNNITLGRKQKKRCEFIFLCFWALNQYPWSHIHLPQGSSKAQKVCAVITFVFAWISEIEVEKQHNKCYNLKNVNVAFYFWALNNYSCSHIHLWQGPSEAHKICCCHHLCLCLYIRDRSWKTTQHVTVS